MMVISKDGQILNLLGLAMRAGKLVLGSDPTLTAIRGNKVQMAFFLVMVGKAKVKNLLINQAFIM
ncbi:hypothetical protein GCM10025884_20590 [Leuconostoc gelidum subsp. gelidum]|nr:hypothetical protein GCM10025884_20590 [Leuconostoc gelidum subsp. gelidum]